MGTPKELPPNFESTAYSTAITPPLLFSTGPPLPPCVVGASNTMSVFVMSPMWPWVVEGRMRPFFGEASVTRSELVPVPARMSFTTVLSALARMASSPAG